MLYHTHSTRKTTTEPMTKPNRKPKSNSPSALPQEHRYNWLVSLQINTNHQHIISSNCVVKQFYTGLLCVTPFLQSLDYGPCSFINFCFTLCTLDLGSHIAFRSLSTDSGLCVCVCVLCACMYMCILFVFTCMCLSMCECTCLWYVCLFSVCACVCAYVFVGRALKCVFHKTKTTPVLYNEFPVGESGEPQADPKQRPPLLTLAVQLHRGSAWGSWAQPLSSAPSAWTATTTTMPSHHTSLSQVSYNRHHPSNWTLSHFTCHRFEMATCVA